MGVSDIPSCRPYDFLCQVARRAVKGAVYSEWAQNNLVQASVLAPSVLRSNNVSKGAVFPRPQEHGNIPRG